MRRTSHRGAWEPPGGPGAPTTPIIRASKTPLSGHHRLSATIPSGRATIPASRSPSMRFPATRDRGEMEILPRRSPLGGNFGRTVGSLCLPAPAPTLGREHVEMRGRPPVSVSTSAAASSNPFAGERIVFLDVDGVLHPYHARQSQMFRKDCMQRLKKIIDATGAKIVLSTSWRRTPQGKAAVNQQLRSHGIPTCVDITRIRHNEYLRHEEILHWIANHPGTTQWVAIDDLPMYQLHEHYIQTSPATGINDRNMQQAIRQLQAT